ncbi:MAG: radical SAM protein [Kiritimatiellia bacterium]
MRIAFCYPPIPSIKGTPLLSQNRQFQWFSHPTAIYPVVPASAATLLQEHGHEVLWLDGIVREMTPETYWDELCTWRPDAIFIETKTPVVKFHWAWIQELKRRLPLCKVILAGDHVTALPEESKNNAAVDVLLKGGDYDFALLSWIEGRAIATDLTTLPPIDRTLTRWKDYAYRNGNFAHTPGAYMMSGRDCWHGKCTFCSWTTLYPTYRVHTVQQALDEVGELIALGAKEIMDDTGSFPIGRWLKDFCEGMIARGYHQKIQIDCNMRFGVLSLNDYRLMKKAGFRLVLFGVESANQTTLDRLKKNLTVAQVREGAQWATKAGLDVHVTLMFGYPWETYADAQRTSDLGRELLRTGHASTLQATWLVPYPGTALFNALQASGDLLSEDWDVYDMRKPVMRCPLTEAEIKAFIARTYRGFLQPQALARRIFSLVCHPIQNFPFLVRGVAALSGHLKDFRQ